MKAKERLYAVKRRLIERGKREWKHRKAVWIGLAVLIVVLYHFQMLASINEISRELDSIDYKLYRMEERMGLIAEQVGITRRQWDGGPRWPLRRP